MSDIKDLTKKIIEFRDKRNWKQFHNPKDMALSLMLEAAELGEHFQWKDGQEIKRDVRSHKAAIGDELADVLYWVLLISYDLQIDLVKAFNSKLKKTETKYPVRKAKGKKTKYTNL